MKLTTEEFEKAKLELFSDFPDIMCSAGAEDIRNAHTISELASVLHKHAVYLRKIDFPSTEWLRKWFSDDIYELNANGIYLDQTTAVKAGSERSIMLFGTCDIRLEVDRKECLFVTACNDSTIRLVAKSFSIVFCVLKDKSRVYTEKDRYAIVKVIDKRHETDNHDKRH